jgi:hypothetical protein
MNPPPAPLGSGFNTVVQNPCKTKHPTSNIIHQSSSPESWERRAWECTRTYLLTSKQNKPSLTGTEFISDKTRGKFIKSTWLFLIAPKRKAPQHKRVCSTCFSFISTEVFIIHYSGTKLIVSCRSLSSLIIVPPPPLVNHKLWQLCLV